LKFAGLGIAVFCVLALILTNFVVVSATSDYSHLSSVESEIVSQINGTNIYNYDLQLENIALNQSLSGYTFRSSGSPGAEAAAGWIQQQFEGFGLETSNETFNLTTWGLLAQPTLVVYGYGGLNVSSSQVAISSFQCEHYSWPTPKGGVNASVVALPPYYDPGVWLALDSTGTVLLVPDNVPSEFALQFLAKINSQTPAAIIFTVADGPELFSPHGGMDYWNMKIPVGWIDSSDSASIGAMMAEENVSAFVSIPAAIGQGTHYNIVAELPGSVDPQKMIVVSAHYDTVMNAGFCGDGSGTAAVLELARVFSEAEREGEYKPQYTLVFVAFAGGDLGFAGSVNYVKQHESEMNNIVAVINLDSLGSQMMTVSQTFPDDNGLNLQSIVTGAAADLGLTVSVINTGGSDQETFRNPALADKIYSSLWGGTSGIEDVNGSRVKSSIMISSSPLDWINTENDTSSTAGWVTAADLESQTQAAGLSIMRVLSTIFSPFLEELYISFAAVAVTSVAAVYLFQSRLRILLKGFTHDVTSLIGGKEVMIIVLLTLIFLVASLAVHSVFVETEITDQGYPAILLTECFGIPFTSLGLLKAEISEGGRVPSTINGPVVFGGAIPDVALFLTAAFLIVFLVKRVIYMRDLNKYYSQ
jgi:hypothetical protein